MSEQIVLDIGCGISKIPGSIGVDQYELSGVDIVHNLGQFPWPFENNSADHIIFSHSISHLEDISKVLTECNRILKSGGIIEIIAPHFSSDNFNTDPTHKIHLGYRSMNYFVDNTRSKYRYINQDIHFLLINSEMSFRKCFPSWKRKVVFNPFKIIGFEKIINLFPRIYERFFCWIFPVSEIYFKLEKKND